MRDYLRIERLYPYNRGMGPSFCLAMWATNKTDWRGQTVIGFKLTQFEKGEKPLVIFDDEGFQGSPLHADDSDATLASLLNFLCLRRGDTDPEYFENYTPEQIEFTEQHAERLGILAYDFEAREEN